MRIWIVTGLLVVGCSSGGTRVDAGVDAEEVQVGDGDGGTDAGTGDEGGDGGGADLWPWCPDSSEYVGGAWDYWAIADELALYCVVNQGATVEEAYGNKARLRVVPGSYPLPKVDETYDLLIPACLELRGGIGSQLAGAGVLTLTTDDWGQATQYSYSLEQPLMADGRLWTVGMDFYVYQAGPMHAHIVMSNVLVRYEDGNEVSTYFELTDSATQQRWMAFPCEPGNFGRREDRATFDRGEITVWHDVYFDLPSGGGAPAILQRGFGELDGVAFDQQDYFKLSHLIAHHNWGGTFLVMFDQPIGGACGIKLAIPSMDGGGPDLGAWTVDCQLNPIEELSGLNAGP